MILIDFHLESVLSGILVFIFTVPLIGEVYMEKILERLHATLSETKSLSDAGNMEPLVSFVCDVAFTFFSSVQDCLLLVSAKELLLTVFQLTAQDQTHTHLSGVFILFFDTLLSTIYTMRIIQLFLSSFYRVSFS